MNYNSMLAFLIALLVVILIIKTLFSFGKRKEYMDSSTENETENQLLSILTNTDLEAFQNLTSMFADGKVILPNLEVNGELTLNGNVTGDMNVTGTVVAPMYQLDGTNQTSHPDNNGSWYTLGDSVNMKSTSSFYVKSGSSGDYNHFNGNSFYTDNLNTDNIYAPSGTVAVHDNINANNYTVQANMLKIHGTASDPGVGYGSGFSGAIFGVDKGIVIKGGGSNYSSSNKTNSVIMGNQGTGDYYAQNGHTGYWSNDLGDWSSLF